MNSWKSTLVIGVLASPLELFIIAQAVYWHCNRRGYRYKEEMTRCSLAAALATASNAEYGRWRQFALVRGTVKLISFAVKVLPATKASIPHNFQERIISVTFLTAR